MKGQKTRDRNEAIDPTRSDCADILAWDKRLLLVFTIESFDQSLRAGF